MATNSELALNLTVAVVTSSLTPALLLDGSFSVLVASASFCRDFQISSTRTSMPVFDLGGGEWNVPQLRSLLKVALADHGDIEAYEMDLIRTGIPIRRLALSAQKLNYGDPNNPRIILTVVDVTEPRLAERAKEDLTRENQLLLKELQHRVFNSLQIIASVLLMSAKRVQSEETRTHLFDAHQRVMSLASVQRQLAVFPRAEVGLRSYLTDLCASIGASMIRNRQELTIGVTADDSHVSADVATTMGLIVTELVINALKHGFPGERGGHIAVDYKAKGPAWLLSVSDDGVGMPEDQVNATAGLGSSIVQALAKRLRSNVTVTHNSPGTSVGVSFTNSDGNWRPQAAL
jgi:two-component sensor histidine kinase